ASGSRRALTWPERRFSLLYQVRAGTIPRAADLCLAFLIPPKFPPVKRLDVQCRPRTEPRCTAPDLSGDEVVCEVTVMSRHHSHIDVTQIFRDDHQGDAARNR